MRAHPARLAGCLALLLACSESSPLDPIDGDFGAGKADGVFCAEPGSPNALAILALVNDSRVGEDELDRGVADGGAGLDQRAAHNIVEARPFADLGALDEVPWVGINSCLRLLDYACNTKALCTAGPNGHYARSLPAGQAGLIGLSLYSHRLDYTATRRTGACPTCLATSSGSYALEGDRLELFADAGDDGARFVIETSREEDLTLTAANGEIIELARVRCNDQNDLACRVPPSWRSLLADSVSASSFSALGDFLAAERSEHGAEMIWPAKADVFAALEKVTPDLAKVILIGQDPYPTPGHANGLCFSVNSGVAVPASLGVIYKELESDLGVTAPVDGDLSRWAEQGMLMLNTVLTVRAREANSHRGKGWEPFTRSILQLMAASDEPRVFIAFGGQAASEAALVLEGIDYVDVAPDGTWTRISDLGDEVLASGAFSLADLTTSERAAIADQIVLVRSAHPAPPFSSKQFLGSRPFSRVNAALALTCARACAAEGVPATPSTCSACRFEW